MEQRSAGGVMIGSLLKSRMEMPLKHPELQLGWPPWTLAEQLTPTVKNRP